MCGRRTAQQKSPNVSATASSGGHMLVELHPGVWVEAYSVLGVRVLQSSGQGDRYCLYVQLAHDDDYCTEDCSRADAERLARELAAKVNEAQAARPAPALIPVRPRLLSREASPRSSGFSQRSAKDGT
jgi:hypothetical protein